MNHDKRTVRDYVFQLKGSMWGVALIATLLFAVPMHPFLLYAGLIGVVWAMTKLACESVTSAYEYAYKEGKEAEK